MLDYDVLIMIIDRAAVHIDVKNSLHLFDISLLSPNLFMLCTVLYCVALHCIMCCVVLCCAAFQCSSFYSNILFIVHHQITSHLSVLY
jgi:hypothetical protein